MQRNKNTECCRHNEERIFIECHCGLVCKGCYRESIKMYCDACGCRICGVVCKGLLGHTIYGILLLCARCYMRDACGGVCGHTKCGLGTHCHPTDNVSNQNASNQNASNQNASNQNASDQNVNSVSARITVQSKSIVKSAH
jgi:hypothetical protein